MGDAGVSLADRIAGAVTSHTRIVIVVTLLATAAVGAGASSVEEASSLEQFQSESAASQKLDYIQQNFTAGGNTTTAQVVVRGGNVLEKESLLAMVRFEDRLRDDPTVNRTLAGPRAVTGIHTVVATAAIRAERAQKLRRRAAEIQRTRQRLAAQRRALANRTDRLNTTARLLRGALTDLRREPNASVRAAFEDVRANTSVELNATDFGTFREAARLLRAADNETDVRAAYRLGTRGVLAEEYAAVERRASALEQRAADLRDRAKALAADRRALTDGAPPTLAEQRAQLKSMNASEIDRVLRRVLAADGNSNGVLALMPTTYEPGTTTAEATIVSVTQTTDGGSQVGPMASDRIVDAQLAIRDIGQRTGEGLDFLTFGGGIVAHEIQSSQSDSLLIVGPLALLFVLVALAVAYRDLLDIVLGVLGIAAVLVWTFGFMGWAGIDFSQVFIAVPVLLIGLSIDYAIHIFMRHREERADLENGPRRSMRVALGGVGIALMWVTAATAIGFLSNLTSPVPPIREFGIVSAVGIGAALLVFGLLVPALKVELDELLEGYGVDRQKRAFGTGGGRFSDALALGATAARRAPYAVILLVLLVSAVGAYGGTQVSTEFSQQDFLADEPPGWMEQLPEPFEPGEYTVKSSLEYINERFVRADSQAQLLVQGEITDDDTLERLARGREAAAGGVTQQLPNGEPAISGPLSAMRSVAATNATFNATFQAADTDGNGVPDRNLGSVYDAFFAAAPDTASRYVHRTDGEYRALRMVVTVSGSAGGGAITEQMRAVADRIEGGGLAVTATGRSILNKIVQDQLLRTVVESLLITLVVVFLFLMATYRVSDGSALLGAVTILPVAFAVAWILGSMALLGIPFNVVTGLITSLTIGLGVAYTIHLSERYTQELERRDSVWEAMRTAVTGTGGALLGSAATTIGGFGTLVFAILPPLQQFGIIAGLSILYSFLGSVFVLPSLLVVWTRYVGPEWAREQLGATAESAAPGAGTPGAGDGADTLTDEGAGED